MISEPTVLILGAGASADYGFPTGRGLLLEILRDANAGCKLFEFLTERMAIPDGDINRFRTALLLSQAPAVDLFLEHRSEFEAIGKLAIAATLIPHESHNTFWDPERPSWYRKLFQLIVEEGSFEANRLSIVHQAKLGAQFDLARRLLCNAREILFLGFGFHAVNLRRLGLQDVHSYHRREKLASARWLACRTGMGDGDVARASAHLEGIPAVEFAPNPNWNISEFLSNTKCLGAR